MIEAANIPTIGTKRLIKSVKETFAKEGITAANTTMLINPLIFPFSKMSFGTIPIRVTITPTTRHTIE